MKQIPEVEILTLQAFVTAIGTFDPEFWIYRGQSDASWSLLPKAGREGHFLTELKEEERGDITRPRDLCRFDVWRKKALAFNSQLPENDFECLALAQHFGLATRLLDWSSNPLVALYFADAARSEHGNSAEPRAVPTDHK